MVKPGEFIFAAAHLDHGHIYGQCNGLVEAGAQLKWVYDPDPAKVDAFRKKCLLEGLEGTVVIEFTVTAAGQIRDPVIRQSSNRIFNRASLATVSRLNCPGKGQDIRVQIPVDFKIK